MRPGSAPSRCSPRREESLQLLTCLPRVPWFSLPRSRCHRPGPFPFARGRRGSLCLSPGNLLRHRTSSSQPAAEQLAVPYKQLVFESHSHCSMSRRREQSLAKDRGWEAGDVLEVGTTWPRHLSGHTVPAAFSASVYGHASFPACPTGAGAGPCPQRQLS